MTDPTPDNTPTAAVVPARKWRWVWLIPIAALLFAAYLFFTYVQQTGPIITLHMHHGHGLKTGDALRCRGIDVGFVEQVTLNTQRDGIVVKVRLEPDAEPIAVEGSRFWVVRPRISLTGFAGLETIAGPQYLAVIPGDGTPTRTFDALEQAPPIEAIDPAGLLLTLKADHRGSLRPGAPVTYRQVHVGAVLSVSLADDASHVRVEAYIEPKYVYTVRQDTVFWNVSGAGFDFGIKGLRFDIESMQTLLDGGIAYATPDPPGEPAVGGAAYTLHEKAKDHWLEWKPDLRIQPPSDADVPDEDDANAAEKPSMLKRLLGKD